MLCNSPISLRDANAFVAARHRHHPPARGCKYTVAAKRDGELVGAAITGRPVARAYDPEKVAEVVRLCTDGTKNACSMLYAASARIAQAMGYEKIITYILASESGVSLRAAGWREAGRVKGASWSRPSRLREDVSPTEDKIRFEKDLTH